MAEFSKEVLSYSKEFWSKQYGYELSDDETSEIVTNLTNYFEALRSIVLENNRKAEQCEPDRLTEAFPKRPHRMDENGKS